MNYLWTSEAVSKGHPDKVADQVADAVLDACLAGDPNSKVACEVTLTTGTAFITGEINTETNVDYEAVVRKAICDAGYNSDDTHFNGNTVEIINRIKKQSTQIAGAVFKEDGEIGAGDQGMMFGYACDETKTLMPLAHHLSFELVKLLEKNEAGIFYPDAKTQVSICCDEAGHPLYVDTVLISTCHKEGISLEELTNVVKETVIQPFAFNNAEPIKSRVLINPAGLWTIGGPAADTGLSGRKIVVDNYGADCPIGGGSFSGKDPTKVDRSAAYAARWIAKNIVESKIAAKCTVQIAYAIGVVEPVSLRVQTDNRFRDAILNAFVKEYVSLTPKSIIERFGLRRPIYKATASGGHFGRDGFPWEQIDSDFQSSLKECVKKANGINF